MNGYEWFLSCLFHSYRLYGDFTVFDHFCIALLLFNYRVYCQGAIRALEPGYSCYIICYKCSLVMLRFQTNKPDEVAWFLPERDYVTFQSLLSQIRLSVTFVHPTSSRRSLIFLAIFLHCCVPWPSSDLHAKFYGDRLRGTPPPGALHARGVANRAILDMSKIMSHKRYTIRPRVQLMYNRK